MDKKYIFAVHGMGHSPHVLVNADNPSDKIALCSCGGTSNPDGFCDGTHHKKEALGCCCWYCKKQADRAGKDMDQKHCTHCA